MNIRLFTAWIMLSLSLLILSACGAGTGQKGDVGSWTFNKNGRAAERPPEDLAESLEVIEDGMQFPREAQGQGMETVEQEPLPGSAQSRIDDGAGMAFARRGQNDPVKVAILLPLSGQHANLGQAMLNAAQLAMFDLGQNRFELLPRDTQGTPLGARDAAQQALKEGAKLILGPLFSSSLSEVRRVASRRSVNVISFSTDWTLAGGNTFLMGFLPFDQIERLVQYVAFKDFENVGVFAPDTDYGRVVTNAYQRVAPYFRLNQAMPTYFDPANDNLTSLLRDFSRYDARVAQAEMAALELGIESEQKIKRKTTEILLDIELPYDAVLLPTGGDTARNVANLMSQFDMPPSKVQRLGTGLMDDPGLAAEQSLDRTIFAAPSPRLREAFEERFKDLYGTAAPRLTTLAYDATALAIVLARNAIQQGDDVEFRKSEILNRNGFSGIDGIFRFRKNGTVERGLALLQFRNGRIQVIDEAPRTFQNSSAAQN